MHIIIVGGGITGLTAAIALQRRGIEAQVYEVATELNLAGKGIWVPTNAMLVLDRLGLGDAVARRGVPLVHAEVRTRDNRMLQAIDFVEIQKHFGRSTVSIRRADLQAILVNSLGEGRLHLGKRCTGVGNKQDTVVASFEDGTTVEADLIIGADGIHSIIRKTVSGNITLQYAGQTCYLGLSEFQLPPNLTSTSWEVWGGANRFGFSPVTPEQVYWFAPITAPEASPNTTEASIIPLYDQYSDFPDPIPHILQNTHPNDIVQVSLYDFHPLEHWSSGRVVLAGDAAHAMTPNLGQGGAQAIEDAYVLSEALASEGTTTAAFRIYEQMRQPKAKRIVRLSRWFGQLAHVKVPWQMGIRNVILRSIPKQISRRQTAGLYKLNY